MVRGRVASPKCLLHVSTQTAIKSTYSNRIISTFGFVKNLRLGHIKLKLCFTDYLPSQGDPAGWKKIKITVCHEAICITKITMITKYLEDTTSVHS